MLDWARSEITAEHAGNTNARAMCRLCPRWRPLWVSSDPHNNSPSCKSTAVLPKGLFHQVLLHIYEAEEEKHNKSARCIEQKFCSPRPGAVFYSRASDVVLLVESHIPTALHDIISVWHCGWLEWSTSPGKVVLASLRRLHPNAACKQTLHKIHFLIILNWV